MLESNLNESHGPCLQLSTQSLTFSYFLLFPSAGLYNNCLIMYLTFVYFFRFLY